MKDYYEARAREYDDWWLGHHLYADRERPGWSREVAALIAALQALPRARTLDVACGTAFLTRHLPGKLVALDQSGSMLEIARARLPGARLVEGEALPLPFPDRSFERLFTSHFYGHLDGDDRERFLGEARRVAAEVVVVDSARNPASPSDGDQERLLRDGTRWSVFKRYFSAEGLADELGGGSTLHAGRWFVAVRA